MSVQNSSCYERDGKYPCLRPKPKIIDEEKANGFLSFPSKIDKEKVTRSKVHNKCVWGKESLMCETIMVVGTDKKLK